LDPKLRIQLLGDFCLYCEDTPVAGVDTPRLQSLLAYLLLHQATPQSRRFVAFLFWPDSVESQALANLRNLVYHLRHALPNADHFLHVDAKQMQWRSDAAFSLDVNELKLSETEAQQAEQTGDQTALRSALERIADLYGGDLLPSCYDDWILPERESLRKAFIAKLAQLVDLLERQRDYGAAIGYAQRLLRCDPMREATYRRLMRLYALSGNRAAALRAYHACATLLRQELGVAPDLLTREAYERLLRKETSSTAPLPTRVELATAAPLVGREGEWSLLHDAYRVAVSGKAELVLLSGEAGIGKTRLAEELLLWTERQGIASAIARCYAAQGELPFAPVAAWIRSLPPPQIEEVWLTEVARLLPELQPDQPVPASAHTVDESWRRHRLFEGLAHMTLDGRGPLVLLLDDVQWCDRDTLEWLHYLLCFDPQAPLLVVGTARVENLMDNDALLRLLNGLRRTDQLAEVKLESLSEEASFALADHLSGGELDRSLAHPLYVGSEGNPLFIVEMLRLQTTDGSRVSVAQRERMVSATLSLPPKVRTVLEARLAQLTPSARELASLAATIGREFTFALLAEASICGEDNLVRDLDELWSRRIIREQGADAYDFSHDRLREVAYDGLSTARRRLLHHYVARALEVQCVEGRGTEFAQIARHFQRAGQPEQAIPYYGKAGEAAKRTFAYAEAVALYGRALELLRSSPPSPDRNQRELELLIALGVPLILARGHADPDVECVYSRAWELCGQSRNPAQCFQVLVGLRRFHFFSGDLRKAHDLGEEIIAQTKNLEEPALVARAHMHHGETLYRMGAFPQAYDHCVVGFDLYETIGHDTFLLDYGFDVGVCCLIFIAIALQYMGHVDQARSQAQRALSLADKVDHPFTSCMGRIFAAFLYRLRRDVRMTESTTESALKIAETYGFAMPTAWGKGLRGWLLVQQGHGEEGIGQIQQCLTDCRSIGTSILLINALADLCQAYAQKGEVAKADHALKEALALMQAIEERCWDAELHRLRGQIALLRQEEAAAEAAFQHAMEIAREQEAKLLELRAVVCLSRLWRSQNKTQEARSLLRAIYGWFSEGLDTPDLQEAEALLRTLA
jgi:DNA-binding SARP family transcriptional activator